MYCGASTYINYQFCKGVATLFLNNRLNLPFKAQFRDCSAGCIAPTLIKIFILQRNRRLDLFFISFWEAGVNITSFIINELSGIPNELISRKTGQGSIRR